jgi:hypothetical protein
MTTSNGTADNARFTPEVVFPGHDRNLVAIPNETPKPDWFYSLPSAHE